MAEHPQAGVDYLRAWDELLAWFPDDAACLRYVEYLRWGDGFACRFWGWWAAGGGSAPTGCVAVARAGVTRR